MRHPQIEAILKDPGIYRVAQGLLYYFIEVDETETVHQLNPHTMERDGVLDRDGWNYVQITITRQL